MPFQGVVGGILKPLRTFFEKSTRPSVNLRDVTRSDIKICMWKAPITLPEAEEGTAKMLVQILGKHKHWTRSPLPANYMKAFERPTYSFSCISVSLMPAYSERCILPILPVFQFVSDEVEPHLLCLTAQHEEPVTSIRAAKPLEARPIDTEKGPQEARTGVALDFL